MKTSRILTLALVCAFPLSATAQTLRPPSLIDTLEFNENAFKNRMNLREKIALKRLEEQKANLPLTYTPILTGSAIIAYKYDTVDIWVQEVDLAKGARIDSIINQYGYDNDLAEPLFAKRSLKDQVNSLVSTPFSVINGQFFNPGREATTLSFGLKTQGNVMTAGADNGTKRKNIFSIAGTTASVLPYSWENLNNESASFALVNLTTATPHYSNESLGRTYICIANPDINNSSSKFLIWTAVAANELTIESEMYRWGCTASSVAKLDSSGSTRLYLGGKYYYGNAHKGVPDYRTTPHAIVIYDR